MWILIVAVVLFLLLELVVRFSIGAPRSERLPLLRVQPHPLLGYQPLPNDIHYGYDQLTALNRLGLRGPEVTAKQPGECRILLLGETQVYGLGIPDKQLLSHVLEVQLGQTTSGQRYRVINLGVRAYKLNQQLALLENLALALEPDLVVILIYYYGLGQADIRNYYNPARSKERFRRLVT
jgi:hypothetical protein